MIAIAYNLFWVSLPGLCVFSILLCFIVAGIKRSPLVPVLVMSIFISLFIWKNASLHFGFGSERASYRLVTLNVGQFQNDTVVAKSIADELRQLDADVVLLQEFGLYHKWPDVQSVAQNYADDLAMPYHRFEPQKDNIFGVAVFSKYPIENWEKIFEQSGPTNEAVLFSVSINNQPLWLVNLHLQSFNFRLPKSDHSYLTPSHVMSKQGLQAEMILNKVSIHNPMLIAGDFNATPGMTAYELFAEQHKDLLRETGNGWRSSLDWLPIRVDHIFSGHGMSAQEVSVVPTASDHHAILCELSF